VIAAGGDGIFGEERGKQRWHEGQFEAIAHRFAAGASFTTPLVVHGG
jgi:hypothetical protein